MVYESLMLVNPRHKKGGGKKKGKGMLGLGGLLGKETVKFSDLAAGVLGGTAVLFLPNLVLPSDWVTDIKGVVSSAVTTIVVGAITYMTTKSTSYTKAVVMGGGIITGLKLLKIITEYAGMTNPVGLSGRAEVEMLGGSGYSGTGITAFSQVVNDEVKVL